MFVSNDPAIQKLTGAICAQPLMRGVSGANLHILPIPSFGSLFEVSDDMFMPLVPMKHSADSAPALILHSSGISILR